ncbi:MAG TPA: TetR family transcriptional regulator [Aeromicrobium sp.]|nr:TetR family transcriptional regulator [Aeromicrobium sp.]
MSHPVLSRQEQKEQTREALLDAALELSQESGFAQVSLRQVARSAGVVPTAFYRHFDSMDDVGLALVERSFGTLRQMMRDAQRDPDLFTDLISTSIDILVATVKGNRDHFAFVGRERLGGSAPVRDAIQRELELFVSETAVAIRVLPVVSSWTIDDVMTLSGLFVRNMVFRAEQVLAMPPGRSDLESDLKRTMRREMLMIVFGVVNWQSRDTVPS